MGLRQNKELKNNCVSDCPVFSQLHNAIFCSAKPSLPPREQQHCPSATQTGNQVHCSLMMENTSRSMNMFQLACSSSCSMNMIHEHDPVGILANSGQAIINYLGTQLRFLAATPSLELNVTFTFTLEGCIGGMHDAYMSYR